MNNLLTYSFCWILNKYSSMICDILCRYSKNNFSWVLLITRAKHVVSLLG